MLRGKDEARALILVKERELTIAIKRFLTEHVTLRREKLAVERFVGGGASQTEAGASADCARMQVQHTMCGVRASSAWTAFLTDHVML